jgi:diacylglycerol kinase family enzyme
VLNRGSGSDETQERVDTLRETFRSAGRHFELLEAVGGAAVRDAARRAVSLARMHDGAVVAAGGDGTISTVADVVLADPDAATAPLPFGALPQGTFNLFGRAFGLPLELADGARALLGAQVQPVQAGRVVSVAEGGTARTFLVNASLGLYPDLLEDREAWKQRLGRSRVVAALAGLATVLSSRGDDTIALQLREAHRAVRTRTLFIGNNRPQLAALGIEEAAALDDGHLVALMVRPVGTLRLLGLAVRGALGTLGEADQVLHFAFDHLTVAPVARGWRRPFTRSLVKVAVDGEVLWMRPPLRFEVAPCPLHLLVPTTTP